MTARVPVPTTDWSGRPRFRRATAAFAPGDAAGVLRVVRDAAAAGAPCRAVGTLCSTSPLVDTDGVVVRAGGLGGVVPFPPAVARPGVDTRRLYDVGAGVTVAGVTAALEPHGLQLHTTGAYTGQTLVGAASTASHGSAGRRPPLCDAIVGVDLVTPSGLMRIEGAAGPTDPSRHAQRRPEVALVQDDRWLGAARVGLGRLGVITSATVAVQPRTWLQETRWRLDWPAARALLADTGADGLPRTFDGAETFELSVNPYRLPGIGRTAVLKRREPTAAQAPRLPPRFALDRRAMAAVDLATNRLGQAWLLPWIIATSLRGIRLGRFVGPASALLGSVGDLPRGSSVELALPLDAAVRVIDRILALLAARRRSGQLVSGWMSIRYVGASAAPLAMTAGGARCFVELVTLAGSRHLGDLFAAVTALGLARGARPHWGMRLEAPWSAIVAQYPGYAAWAEVVRAADPAGTFGGPLTRGL